MECVGGVGWTVLTLCEAVEYTDFRSEMTWKKD